MGLKLGQTGDFHCWRCLSLRSYLYLACKASSWRKLGPKPGASLRWHRLRGLGYGHYVCCLAKLEQRESQVRPLASLIDADHQRQFWPVFGYRGPSRWPDGRRPQQQQLHSSALSVFLSILPRRPTRGKSSRMRTPPVKCFASAVRSATNL